MVNVFVYNYGRSPAVDVRIDTHIVFGEKAVQGCYAASKRSEIESRRESGAVIGPNGKYVWATAITLEDEMSYPMHIIPWNGTEPILLYAVIYYKDIFTRAHRSKTCLKYLQSGHAFLSVPGQTWIDYDEEK